MNLITKRIFLNILITNLFFYNFLIQDVFATEKNIVPDTILILKNLACAQQGYFFSTSKPYPYCEPPSGNVEENHPWHNHKKIICWNSPSIIGSTALVSQHLQEYPFSQPFESAMRSRYQNLYNKERDDDLTGDIRLRCRFHYLNNSLLCLAYRCEHCELVQDFCESSYQCSGGRCSANAGCKQKWRIEFQILDYGNYQGDSMKISMKLFNLTNHPDILEMFDNEVVESPFYLTCSEAH